MFIFARFIIDRLYVKETVRIGFSPIITDVTMYIVGTVVMIISLELFAGDNISRPLAITLVTIVLFMLSEKDVYLHPDVYGKRIEKGVLEDLDDDIDDDIEKSESDEEEKLWPDEQDEENKEDHQKESDKVNEEKNDSDDSIAAALKIAESVTGVLKTESIDTEFAEESSEDTSTEGESVKEGSVKDGYGEDVYEDIQDGIEKQVSFATSSLSDDSEEAEEDESEEYISDDSGRIVIAEIIRNLMYIATAVLGVLVLRDIFAQKYGVLYYLVVVLSAILCVILRAVYRGTKLLTKEETGTKTALVSYFVTAAIFAVFFGFFSILIGLVYLLGAFIVRMVVPWVFDNWGSGGTVVVCRRKDVVSRIVARVFALIIVLLAVWQLSYGVLWETEFLAILAVAITSTEPLLKQNLYFEELEEEKIQEENIHRGEIEQ